MQKFNLALLILNCFLLTGCHQQVNAEKNIVQKKQAYENWLIQQRPFLASLPKSAIINYTFTTFDSGNQINQILPSVIYDLKAGQWDGVLELWFIMKLDTQGQPIGFYDETFTFFRLPAVEAATSQDGKKRNVYYGIKLARTEDVVDIIKRIEIGGDFSDYPKQTNGSGVTYCGFLDSNDPWKNHKTK